MFDRWRRERMIRRILKKLSRQRVALILQPGNVWVVEMAVSEGDKDVAEALRTCHLRGWVDMVHDAVPRGRLGPNAELPRFADGIAPVYRLTEAGWAELRRTHDWTVGTFLVSLLALVAAVLALFVAPRP
jgi:hypothetical protein